MALLSNTLAIVDAVLKRIYRQKNLGVHWYKARPLFGLVPKFEGFGGKSDMPIPLIYSEGGGVSGTLALAQAQAAVAAGSQASVSFALPRRSTYGDVQIPGESIEASREDNFAFVSMMTKAFEGARNKLANSIETQLFRKSTGAICQAGYVDVDGDGTYHVFSLGTTDATLAGVNANCENIVNFEVGDALQFAATDGGAVFASGEAVVIKIDRMLGVLTVDGADPTGLSDGAVTTFIHKTGLCYNNGSTNTHLNMDGLEAWFPSYANYATDVAAAFMGVTRSVDSRTAGQYVDQASLGVGIEDTLIVAQSKQSREETSPSVAVMPHVQHRKLLQELGSRKIFTVTYAQSALGAMADVGYRGVIINGDRGDITTVSASRCPGTQMYLLSPESLLLATLFAPLRFINEDGLDYLRLASDDGIEARMVCRGNLACNQPAANTNITLVA